MTELSDRIQAEVAAATALLRAIDPIQWDRPGRWSAKELLGHLIDSAANNHQRIVRALLQGNLSFPAYEQDRWVQIQCYNDAHWEDLIALFTAYNTHIARLIASIPPEGQGIQCRIGRNPPVTLGEMAEDYLRHLRHHLQQILKP